VFLDCGMTKPPFGGDAFSLVEVDDVFSNQAVAARI
jgi:hypothetical protein